MTQAKETTDTWSDLVVAIPTFRRNEQLAGVLQSIAGQSVQPGLVLILDNAPDGAAEPIAESSPVRAEYVRLGRNMGPAGSFAQAMTLCRGRFEWLMCRDDDYPFAGRDEIAKMRAFSMAVSHLRPAGIGNTGERFFHSRGRSHRLALEELRSADWLEVDGLSGAGSPTYHLPTVGDRNFDPGLFFGFEELDFGMRLRSAGHRLLLNTQQTIAMRQAAGRLDIRPFDLTPGRRTSEWRSYFSHRNRMLVALRYRSFRGAVRLGVRSLVKAAAELTKGSPERSLATLLGLWDGVRTKGPRAAYIPR